METTYEVTREQLINAFKLFTEGLIENKDKSNPIYLQSQEEQVDFFIKQLKFVQLLDANKHLIK